MSWSLDNLSIEERRSLSSHFKSSKPNHCGEYVVKSILSMYGKPTSVTVADDDGASPKKIIAVLKGKGIKSEVKDNIQFDEIEPKSIAYYLKSDHYVAIEKVMGNKILVNDSDKSKGETMSRKEFESKWLDKDDKGWIITTGVI